MSNRRWVATLCAGFAGNAAREIVAVLPAAAEFAEPVARVSPVTVIHGRLLGATWERLQREVSVQYPGSVLFSLTTVGTTSTSATPT